jgi:4'-phosphopantetheinyl transferase
VHASSGLEFNLSHSGSYVVYAVTHAGPVGIDIEQVRDIAEADELVLQYFSAAEIEAYRALPIERRNLGFLAGWTRKEAFVKAIGEGLSHPLDTFDVSIDPDAPARINRIAGQIDHHKHWSLISLRPYPGYIGAIAHQCLEAKR